MASNRASMKVSTRKSRHSIPAPALIPGANSPGDSSRSEFAMVTVFTFETPSPPTKYGRTVRPLAEPTCKRPLTDPPRTMVWNRTPLCAARTKVSLSKPAYPMSARILRRGVLRIFNKPATPTRRPIPTRSAKSPKGWEAPTVTAAKSVLDLSCARAGLGATTLTTKQPAVRIRMIDEERCMNALGWCGAGPQLRKWPARRRVVRVGPE